jgi:hypothetical protein
MVGFKRDLKFQSGSRSAQGTFEYVMLLVVIMAVYLLFQDEYREGIRQLGEVSQLPEKSRRAYTNGNFRSYGYRELDSNQASGADPREELLHPTAQPDGRGLLFRRSNSN